MPTKKPAKNDMDALLKEDLEANRAKANRAEITLNDQVWHLMDAGSVVAGLDLFSGDEENAGPAYIDWIVGMVVDEEKAAFRSLIRRISGLDVAILLKLGNAMTEELTDRPTKLSGDSSDSLPVPASKTPSTVNSSLPDAPRSESYEDLTL